MTFIRYFEKMKTIDDLIRRKATGNQTQFAQKIRVSRSTLNGYLQDMRILGFPIRYCRQRCTYYYDVDGSMNRQLFSSNISSNEAKKITGGSVPCSDLPNFLEFFAV